MPTIRPFKALRYNQEIAGLIPELVAPPYDIIYDEWRNQLYSRNTYNIIRLIKTREEPGDRNMRDKYERANNYIQAWIEKGVLKMDDKPSMYVLSDTYDIEGTKKTRYGFTSLLRLPPTGSGVEFGNRIHPHERTLSSLREDRLHLVKATRTNLCQIFSIFKDPGQSIQKMLLTITRKQPDVEFSDEQGIQRRMWIVSDPLFVQDITDAMRDRDILIADGHHRYETALAYRDFMEKERTQADEPFDYVTMYFSSADEDGMTILPTHRKVQGLESLDKRAFFIRLEDMFDIEYVGTIGINEFLYLIGRNSDKTTIFGFYSRDGFRIARLKNPSVPKMPDVEILHDEIIEKRLNITREDIAAGRYLHFCRSAKHAVEDVATGKDNLAIFMNALTSEELFRRVLNPPVKPGGDRMPQKSTYFYPKTLSGLVMYKIDRQSIE